MAIGSSHINMNFRLSRALSPILLSKMTDFSPKNITFFAVKTFWAVPDTLQCYQLNPRTSADPGGYLTQKFGVEFPRGLEPLCKGQTRCTDVNLDIMQNFDVQKRMGTLQKRKKISTLM